MHVRHVKDKPKPIVLEIYQLFLPALPKSAHENHIILTKIVT